MAGSWGGYISWMQTDDFSFYAVMESLWVLLLLYRHYSHSQGHNPGTQHLSKTLPLNTNTLESGFQDMNLEGWTRSFSPQHIAIVTLPIKANFPDWIIQEHTASSLILHSVLLASCREKKGSDNLRAGAHLPKSALSLGHLVPGPPPFSAAAALQSQELH